MGFGDVAKHFDGPVGRATIAAHFHALERHLFPEAGDDVDVYHGGCWRRGTVVRVADFSYDIALVNDGSWTPEELKHFRDLFSRADRDDSGFVDRNELQELLIELEHPSCLDDEAVDDMFRRVDKDGSGGVSFDEFCDLVYVELKELIGVDTFLTDVPRDKLKLEPQAFRSSLPRILDVRVQPFADIFRGRDNARSRTQYRDKRSRLDALSKPRVIAVVPTPKQQRPFSCTNRTESRAAIARNNIYMS